MLRNKTLLSIWLQLLLLSPLVLQSAHCIQPHHRETDVCCHAHPIEEEEEEAPSPCPICKFHFAPALGVYLCALLPAQARVYTPLKPGTPQLPSVLTTGSISLRAPPAAV